MHPVGAELFQTDMTKLTVAVRSFANALNKGLIKRGGGSGSGSGSSSNSSTRAA
jgi:hypothetical protein